MVIGVDGNEANVKSRVGSGQYAFELLDQFAKCKDHKFIIYLKDQPFGDLPKESENFRYKVFGPKKLWTQFALPIKLILGQKPDVFFSMAHYGPRFSRIPYVVTIHDLSYLHYPQLFKKNDLYQLTAWSKYSILNCAKIIAVSETTKKDIIKNYKIEPSKIAVIYEGYDQNRFKPQSRSKIENVKEKYKIIGNYIIFVGTLQPRKNIERLIEAFYKLVQSSKFLPAGRQGKVQNLQLVIAGKKGWLYEPIFEKVKNLHFEQKVIFTDYVSDTDLPALLGGASVYVLPSLWEGFGIPVIEAQACKVSVVVSNTSSLPEIVGEGGLLVDPESVDSIENGMRKILIDENLREKLITKGLQNIKRFSWQKCAQETLNVLIRVALNNLFE